MITIKKGKEPISLTKYRASGGKKFDDLDSATKTDIRDSLLKEQGYICAYCMKRIGRDRNHDGLYQDVKIEHVIPRAITQKNTDPDIKLLEIQYDNLVAVCTGSTNGELHCDTSKANNSIGLHPCNPAVEGTIKYLLKDGEIKSVNPSWNDDLSDKKKLNLNHPTIKNNRRAALDGLRDTLDKSNYSNTQLAKMLDILDNKPCKAEYIGIMKYYLRKKLTQKKHA